MSKRSVKKFYLGLSVPSLAVLLFLFALPLSFTIAKAFANGAEAIKAVFTAPYTYRLLLFTLKESLLSAAVSVVLALPFSYYFASFRFKGRNTILALSALSFTIPSILVVLGFVIFYGNSGILNNMLKMLFGLEEPPVKVLYTFFAIILAHVYLNMPVAFNLITNGWAGLSDKEEMASLTLKKSRCATFYKIPRPTLNGVIKNAYLIIFLFCFSSFAIVMVLGGNPAYSTLESEIYRKANIMLDQQGASALALFGFLVTGMILLITTTGRRKERIERAEARNRKLKKKDAVIVFFLVLMLLLFILPPMLSIFYRSFFTKSGEFSLHEWMKIFDKGNFLTSILNSLAIAAISALLSTVLSEALAVYSSKTSSKAIPLLATLPLATGSVMLGLGYNFVAAKIGTHSLLSGYLMILATHMVLSMPFALRTMLPGAKEIPERVSQASYTLKKGRLKTYLDTERPLLKNYRRKAFIFSFALSLGEVNATLTLSGGKITTLPIQIYRLIGSYSYQGAAALGSVLLILAFIVFLAGENIGRRKDGISRNKQPQEKI